MTKRLRQPFRSVSCLLFLLHTFLITPLSAAEPLAIDQSPYRVELCVSWTEAVSFTPTQKSDWTRQLQERLARLTASAWEIHSAAADWATRQTVTAITTESLKARLEKSDADVVVLLAIDEPGASQRVTLRLFQPKVPRISALTVLETTDPRSLVDQTALAIHAAFRPEAAIEQVQDQTALLRIRAGELGPADSCLPAGAALGVSIRFSNRHGDLQRIQPVPWTYLTMTQGERTWGIAKIHSGLKAALGGKTRGRVELAAVAVHPEYSHSEVQFVSQTKPPLPLIAQRVQIADRPWQPRLPEADPKGNAPPSGSELTEEDAMRSAEGPAIEQVTDRLGRIRVSVTPDRPLVWLNVFSGSSVLARVPYIPGCEPLATLELPDDAVRLKVEGELSMLQSQLIEAVAQRSTVLSAIRRLARQNQLEKVGELLKEFDTLPDDKQFLARLGVIRLNGQEQARLRRQRAVETRIARMCDDVAALVKRFLDPDQRKVVEEELSELRKLAAQDKKDLESQPAGTK